MAFKKDLSIDFLGVKCENPFFLSSSPVGGNYEMCAKALKTGWAGVYFKTVGVFVADECSPRFDSLRLEGGPWAGFKNMEQISDKPTEKNLGFLKQLKEDFPEKVIVASIMGSNDEEWAYLAKAVTEVGADLIECNFSCPQMTSSTMGSDVGTTPELVKNYCRIVSSNTNLPVIAKMTPNITNMELPAIAAIEGGAAGLSAINTVKSITNVDREIFVGMPVVNGKSSVSGYSGNAVKPIGLRFVSDLKRDPKLADIPVSGIGGIETWEDALDFLLLGCRNLQVTTAVMQYGYRIVEDMISGLSYYMESHGFDHLDDLIGKALPSIIPAEDLDRSFKLLPDFDEDRCVGCGRCYVSCFDGGHQAITFDEETRKPKLDEDKCVGCHLCLNVCPVMNCIKPGKVVAKPGCEEHDIIMKTCYR